MTTHEPDSRVINDLAGRMFVTLRDTTATPADAMIVCLVVLYHLWERVDGKDFEGWHQFIMAQLAQLHVDNHPQGSLQ